MTRELTALLRIDASHNKHARKCKQDLADCRTCQQNIAWYRSLPLTVLARVLEDRPTKLQRFKDVQNAA